jgi:hypothetical protein
MNGAILAIIALIVLIWVLRKRNQHSKEAEGKILADIWLETGRSVKGLVRPGADGWVRLGKLGDYRLATPKRICKCGCDESEHEKKAEGKEVVVMGCAASGCKKFELDKTIAPIRRWGKYPSNPFLGLRTLQVDVVTESWWRNNPEPITPEENRTRVTALDAAFHTRQGDTEKASEEINEQVAMQKQLNQAIANQPNKMVLYLMVGVNILVGVIILIQMFTQGG